MNNSNEQRPDSSTRGRDRFFSRTDWSAFWTVFLLALGAYTATLAPTVTLEDSGELIVASDYLGVPHPPGYPIWTLCSWLFQRIFHFVTFHGHPNPAWGVAFFSAFSGALACAVLALLVSRSGSDMLRRIPRFDQVLGGRTEVMFCWVGGVAAGLLLTFSPVLWSQSVIAEVYSLNTLFQMLVLLLLYRWMMRPEDPRTLYVMALIFGLGLTNHQTLLFIVPALMFGVMMRKSDLFRDFVIVGGLLAGVMLLDMAFGKLKLPEFTWIAGPSAPGFWIITALFVLIPLLAMRWLPNGRVVGITLLLAELGVAFYAYMPLASEQNPPMNWGYAREWDGFIHAISRGQYEQVKPSDIFTLKFIEQCFGFLSDTRNQFSLPLLLAAFLPFTAWKFEVRRRPVHMLSAAALLIAAVVALVAVEFAMIKTGREIPGVLVSAYKAGAGLVIVLALVGMALLVMKGLDRLSEMMREGNPLTSLITALITGLTALATGYVLFMTFRHIGISPTLTPPAKVIFIAGILGAAGCLYLLWKLRETKVRVSLETEHDGNSWLLATWAGFMSVSFMFVLIMNPQLDLQTVFITRVQFIQSHAICALWIGLGVIFTLAITEMLFRGSLVARTLLALLALAAIPGVPLAKNWHDPYIVTAFGGAEQNGHAFGWYFGNWSLRGAEGIREDLRCELSPGEFQKAWASYPDPSYPAPMTTNAIFYGGTDPGRFVPTYMIYSAKVRPDIFLITQNALADTTYLNVMRDLYGNQIYISSIHDSNIAFQKYYSGVQAGRLRAGADVKTEDGRISVEGVGGVMQINATLSRGIFEKNKARHDFYVEESYAIPWMYDYLTPNGLIMKLNRVPTPITDEMTRKDHAFWDWVIARLVSNPKFMRDVCARKSFSKLRTSLAGLYAARGRPVESERAFLQALKLYPLSPEAVFRLSDFYLGEGRFDDARKLVAEYKRGDPGNDRLDDFDVYVSQYEGAYRQKKRLEARVAAGTITMAERYELALYYRDFREPEQMAGVALGVLNSPAPAQTGELLKFAYLCEDAGRSDLVERFLTRITAQDPGNAEAWMQLAAARMILNRPDPTMAAIKKAFALDPDLAVAALRAYGNLFAPLLDRPDFRALISQHGTRLAPPPPQAIPENLKNIIR